MQKLFMSNAFLGRLQGANVQWPKEREQSIPLSLKQSSVCQTVGIESAEKAAVPTISVVICTLNRAGSLGRVLESAGRLVIPEGINWELIVVDNGSTDDTAAVARSFADSSHVRVRYVLETRKGTSRARNAGIRESQGEIIAFTDDDMVLDRDWLSSIVEHAAKDSSTSIYFGQTRPLHPGQAKIAMREGDEQETYAFPCSFRDPGSSNNMILRRSAVSFVDAFDTSLGPGTPCRAAEDIDLTYRVLRKGGVVQYCPDILAYHDHARSTPDDIRSLLFAYALGAGAFYCKHILRRDSFALKSCYWEIKAFLRVLVERKKFGPVFLHLAGMTAGFGLRLGVEARLKLVGE
jgi:glycosyltransferase involved in cell wall biosynthesis